MPHGRGDEGKTAGWDRSALHVLSITSGRDESGHFVASRTGGRGPGKPYSPARGIGDVGSGSRETFVPTF